MIGNCCQEAMEEVEATGTSEKFQKGETVEDRGRLVTPFKCTACGDRWQRQVDTRAPDKCNWHPVGR